MLNLDPRGIWDIPPKVAARYPDHLEWVIRAAIVLAIPATFLVAWLTW